MVGVRRAFQLQIRKRTLFLGFELPNPNQALVRLPTYYISPTCQLRFVCVGHSLYAFQWTYGEDRCNGNLVSGNTIATYGNECVEMKEGSSGNVVEGNVCSNQRDANSGCLGSRGDSNTFRYP